MKYTIIRFSSLGDCILLCPVLSSLKSIGAEEVTIVTKTQYADVFRATRGVDRIVALGPKSSLKNLYQIARILKDKNEVLIDAHNNLRSRLLSLLSGKRTVHLKKYYLRRLLLMLFKKKTSLPHVRDRYASLCRAAGITPREGPESFEAILEIPKRIEDKVRSSLADARRKYIALAPGSRWPMKKWGDDKYSLLAMKISKRYDCDIIMLGDANDAASCKAISARLGQRAIDLSGKTSILEAAAYLKYSQVLICNDSGLMHLAEAMGTPVLALFGPTVEAFGYYPRLPQSKSCERSLPCRPCSRNGSRNCILGTQECLNEISVEAVEEIFDDLVSNRGPRRYVLP